MEECRYRWALPILIGRHSASRTLGATTLSSGAEVGENGFLVATIRGRRLIFEYRDVGNRLLLNEQFEAGGGGEVSYTLLDRASILTERV